jgi:hypothetical protein
MLVSLFQVLLDYAECLAVYVQQHILYVQGCRGATC